eukprot:6492195-Amphidinium_carterae.2
MAAKDGTSSTAPRRVNCHELGSACLRNIHCIPEPQDAAERCVLSVYSSKPDTAKKLWPKHMFALQAFVIGKVLGSPFNFQDSTRE